MLVINVTCYIMDIKIIQYDMIYCSIILCNSGNTGSIHCVCVIIRFIFFGIGCTFSVICQFQAFDLDVLCIFDQNTGRYLTFPFMIPVIKRCSVIQIPLAMTICIDLWSVSLSISRDLNRCFSSTAVFFCKLQSLIFKHRSLFQENCISRLKIKGIHFIKCLECLAFGSSVIAVTSAFGINIICCSCRSILSFSINSNCRHH